MKGASMKTYTFEVRDEDHQELIDSALAKIKKRYPAMPESVALLAMVHFAASDADDYTSKFMQNHLPYFADNCK